MTVGPIFFLILILYFKKIKKIMSKNKFPCLRPFRPPTFFPKRRSVTLAREGPPWPRTPTVTPSPLHSAELPVAQAVLASSPGLGRQAPVSAIGGPASPCPPATPTQSGPPMSGVGALAPPASEGCSPTHGTSQTPTTTASCVPHPQGCT